MAAEQTAKNLHALEVRVLRAYEPGEDLTAERLERELGYKQGHANQAFSWLTGKGLLKETGRKTLVFYEITESGKRQAQAGTAEECLLAFLKENGPATLPEVAAALSMEQKDAGSAFGALSKEGAVKMDSEKKAAFVKEPSSSRMKITRSLLERGAKEGLIAKANLSAEEAAVMASIAKKRGAADAPFRIAERDVVTYTLTEQASAVKAALEEAGLTGMELGAVTPDLLKSGEWKNAAFRAYNIGLPPARVVPGRSNPYAAFLEATKDKLCSLGFEEFDGPLVETEFWNSDALFMPQFHAARDIHDVYYIKEPVKAKAIEEPFLSNVAQTHEDGGDTGSRGWNYSFDREFTKRLILRSQGTVLSAHTLASKPNIPGKYFGIVRCFRYDKVDATHLADFYQTEGIVLGKEVNLRTLLGFLQMFAVEIAGATDVKYVPGYFPFTEPSIEVHIKHPKLGWFELGGSGIFRPEVTRPLGIDVPVLAWGIGIDRMALMALGLNDLRELFSSDIEGVRLRRA